MKKTLAFILVCALLVSAFTMTSFAAHTWGGDDGQVQGEFTGGPSNGTISVKVDAVVHKYAVDVTYTSPTFNLPGMTWNVNTHSYDVGTFTVAPVEIEVTNHSDLDVYTALKVTDSDTNDFITFAGDIDTGSVKVDKVNWTASTNSGSVNSAEFSINTVSTGLDLVQAVNYYANKDGVEAGDTVTIATYVITVSKNVIVP